MLTAEGLPLATKWLLIVFYICLYSISPKFWCQWNGELLSSGNIHSRWMKWCLVDAIGSNADYRKSHKKRYIGIKRKSRWTMLNLVVQLGSRNIWRGASVLVICQGNYSPNVNPCVRFLGKPLPNSRGRAMEMGMSHAGTFSGNNDSMTNEISLESCSRL